MDNNRASSMLPKLWIPARAGLVGEHSSRRRRRVARHAGASGKANVGISNDNAGGNPAHRKTKVS
jgi:hypothetical protein